MLIVDDETVIRLDLPAQPRSAGLRHARGRDGDTALALARTEQPDLILLDIMLPELDGWHVAEELAEQPETREIPIMFLSARSEHADELRGHAAAAWGTSRSRSIRPRSRTPFEA